MLLNHKSICLRVAFLILSLAGILVYASANAQTSAKASSGMKLPRIVDVGADKCIPCIKMAPELESLRKEYDGVLEVEFVDVWKRPQDAEAYRVRGIPTQIFYDSSGKEVARHLGFISKNDILAKFKELGMSINKATTKGK